MSGNCFRIFQISDSKTDIFKRRIGHFIKQCPYEEQYKVFESALGIYKKCNEQEQVFLKNHLFAKALKYSLDINNYMSKNNSLKFKLSFQTSSKFEYLGELIGKYLAVEAVLQVLGEKNVPNYEFVNLAIELLQKNKCLVSRPSIQHNFLRDSDNSIEIIYTS